MCFLISSADLYDQIGPGSDAPGIYKLRCLQEATYQGEVSYRSIPRLLAPDAHGVLYIGSSQNVRSRIMHLRQALCAAAGRYGYENEACHPCGKKYSRAVQAQLPIDCLCVTAHPIQEHANYGHAEDYEVAELRNYEEIFGEVPPFNDGHPRARGRP